MKRVAAPTFAISALLAGCAHLPDATVGYYLPTSEVSFKVIRTIACDASGNPVMATAVTPTVRHFANKIGTDAFKTVSLKRLNGDMSDADVKFEFYEDGRLSAINATATGQGEAVLKTAITLAATLVKAGTHSLLQLPTNQCQQIKDFGGGKPLTVTYTKTVSLADGATTVIDPDADSAFYAETFQSVLLPLTAMVVSHSGPEQPMPVAFADGDKAVLIRARQPGTVHITVTVPGAPKPLWEDDLTVATFGKNYVLPVPRPVIFGTKTLAVAFAESGAIKSLQYVSKTGAGQALNVASAGLTAVQGDTTPQQAAEVKAEADLIAQQQRLVACKADPTTCK